MKVKKGMLFSWTKEYNESLDEVYWESDNEDTSIKYEIVEVSNGRIHYKQKYLCGDRIDWIGEHCLDEGWIKLHSFPINPNFKSYVKAEEELK